MDDDESPPQVVLPLFRVAQMTVGGGGRDGLHSDEDVALDAAQQSPPPRRAPLMTATLTLAPPQQPGSVVARLPSARSSSSTTKRRSRSKPLVFSTKAAAVLDKRAFRVETLEYQRDAVQRAQKPRHHKSRSPPSRPPHQATARRSAAAGGGGAPSAAATAAFPSPPPPQQAPPWLEHGRRAVCNAPLMERSSDATMIDVPVALHVDLQARVVDDRHNDKIAGDSDGDGEYDEIIDGVIIHRFAAAPRQDSIKVLPSPVRTVLASPQPFASPTPHRQQHMSHSPPVQPLHSSASLNGLPSPITPQLAPGGAASPAPAPRPLNILEAKAVEFQLRYGMSAGSAVHFARRSPMRTPLPFFFD